MLAIDSLLVMAPFIDNLLSARKKVEIIQTIRSCKMWGQVIETNMTTSHSQWYQSLDPETKATIRQLSQRKPVWNLTLPLFVFLWIGLGILVMRAPHWSIQVVEYVLMGMVIHGIGNFMHEGIHGTMFRSKRWNRWIGFLAGAPTLLAVSAFGCLIDDRITVRRRVI